MQSLKDQALVEHIGERGVSIPPLYVECAKWEATASDPEARRSVWYDEEEALPIDFTRMPSGMSWADVRRVCVRYSDPHGYGLVREIDWRRCVNVEVLEISIRTGDTVDLSALECLRSLKLRASGGRLRGLGKLVKLGWLELVDINCARRFEEIGNLRKLQVLRLRTSCSLTNPSTEGQVSDCKCKSTRRLDVRNVKNCILLKELVVECGCSQEAFPDLVAMTSLRKVVFKGCRDPAEVGRLGSHASQLEELRLINCFTIRRILHVRYVASLEVLVVDRSAHNLKRLPELKMLKQLRKLTIRHAPDLIELPELAGLTALEELKLHNLPNVRELPDMNQLKKLRKLTIRGAPGLIELPELAGLTALEELRLDDLLELRKLTIRGAPRLLKLPELAGLTALEELRLDDLEIVRKLPSMNQLKKLRKLTIRGAPQLLQLPELAGLTALEELRLDDLLELQKLTIKGAPRLLKLPELAGLAALEELELDDLSIVRELPDMNQLKKLRKLTIKGAPRLLKLPELAGLAALKELELDDLSIVRELPDMNQLMKLRKIDLSRCPRLSQLPLFATALETLHLRYLPEVRDFPGLSRLTNLEGFLMHDSPLLEGHLQQCPGVSLVKQRPISYYRDVWRVYILG
jgi:Leucine-rich repeat (LRR) protein